MKIKTRIVKVIYIKVEDQIVKKINTNIIIILIIE